MGTEVMRMALSKPDDASTLDQVLKLVGELTPEEQEQVVEEFKLQWLRRELAKADSSVAQGKLRSAEDVFATLEEKYRGEKAGPRATTLSFPQTE